MASSFVIQGQQCGCCPYDDESSPENHYGSEQVNQQLYPNGVNTRIRILQFVLAVALARDQVAQLTSWHLANSRSASCPGILAMEASEKKRQRSSFNSSCCYGSWPPTRLEMLA
jgi:hypothetical protein